MFTLDKKGPPRNILKALLSKDRSISVLSKSQDLIIERIQVDRTNFTLT